MEPAGPLNLAFVEGLYDRYLKDPGSVPESWRGYFSALPDAEPAAPVADAALAYRVHGHRAAKLDPLGLPRAEPPDLDPSATRLRNAYCRSIGVQFMHLDDPEEQRWLQERMEPTENRLALPPHTQRRILQKLIDASVFEEFLQKKFVGAKTFSLEGAESLIPLLDLAIEEAGAQGCDEVILAMAHRGRLNVLANIMGQSLSAIFAMFREKGEPAHDVKYHMGWSADRGSVHLSLCFNPSHLEYVNPVALGRVKAKQDRGRRATAILIHGDASFAGEGVIQETLNLSELATYATGGTLHVIVNNQIGFTTPPEEGRSGSYPTDLAKSLQIPIFHVNGEDPEAVAQALKLAMSFRKERRRDAIIDMWCYRRRGHNEGDEPSFTQPLLYRAIEQRKPVRERYWEHLGLPRAEFEALLAGAHKRLEEGFAAEHSPPSTQFEGVWAPYAGGPEPKDSADTSVPRQRLSALLERLASAPPGFRAHPKLKGFLDRRRKMAAGELPLDWAAAEALALVSLAEDGYRVRLTGQDTERGTFSQRHAVLHDYDTGAAHDSLAPALVRNSPLSENGPLGFEYGYSLDTPDGLILWEAQFGDFANAAQVYIDQFIAAAEKKWRRCSGLVLLLPHGFEGAGPEHASARIERFLLLAAEDNIQLVQPTTPAQYFHVLRRQALRKWRKPLVVFTPKSLLRHPDCTSSLDELASGGFQRLMREGSGSRQVACSGKLCYELRKKRPADVTLLRLEQLYPTPELPSSFTWVQEECANMGALPYLKQLLGDRVRAVAPPASPSPGAGSTAAFRAEQQSLVARAYA